MHLCRDDCIGNIVHMAPLAREEERKKHMNCVALSFFRVVNAHTFTLKCAYTHLRMAWHKEMIRYVNECDLHTHSCPINVEQ